MPRTGSSPRRWLDLRGMLLLPLLLPLLLLQPTLVHAETGSQVDALRDGDDVTRLALNTLTTSCNGGCGSNAPCVIVGQSSVNPINCVNNTQCTTLQSGSAALCMEPFDGQDSLWGFYPASAETPVGVAPFERVGLVQLGNSVSSVLFRRADDNLGPLTTAMDVSSLNLQASQPLFNVTLDSLQLSGLENALPVSAALQININNCELSAMPIQLVSGSNLNVLDISGNAIKGAPSKLDKTVFPALDTLNLRNNELQSFDAPVSSFPALAVVHLDNNALTAVPPFLFKLSTLRALSLENNPLNASYLTAEQFTFLAGLDEFVINGTTPTEACPSEEVQSKLGEAFEFCVDTGGSGSDMDSDSGSGSDPSDWAKLDDEADEDDDGFFTTWVIVGISVGGVVLLLLLVLLIACCRRRARENEPHKPTYTSMGSFGGNAVEELQDHHYHSMAYPAIMSNASSDTSSDYEMLGNMSSSGPGTGLTRLSYKDVFLDKLLRVSARSELWLGECFDEPVVIKKIKAQTVSRAVMRDFVQEVQLMAGLAHPRIVAFKGALWDPEGTELCAVVEHVEAGPLRDVTTQQVALSVPKQHAIARQIAEALTFLHDQQIVHGRLNAFNILLDADMSAKLSLFAIFHYVRLSPLDVECGVFVAPEVQRGQQPTEKADVYAFGIVLVELDTGESPAENRKRRGSEHQALFDSGHSSSAAAGPSLKQQLQIHRQQQQSATYSPTADLTGFSLSENCSAMMKALITACVDRDPARRPTMAQITMALRTGEMTL